TPPSRALVFHYQSSELVIASEAKQSTFLHRHNLDCFVASLLAMTAQSGARAQALLLHLVVVAALQRYPVGLEGLGAFEIVGPGVARNELGLLRIARDNAKLAVGADL